MQILNESEMLNTVGGNQGHRPLHTLTTGKPTTVLKVTTLHMREATKFKNLPKTGILVYAKDREVDSDDLMLSHHLRKRTGAYARQRNRASGTDSSGRG